MSEQISSKVVNFKESKSKTVKIEKEKVEYVDKSKQSETTDTQSNQDSILPKKKYNDAESETSLNHIKNIDLYDRLNFQRLQVKRSSVKCKTNICVKPKINIQKITEEIYKYVEDIEPQQTQSSTNLTRKRTIKFATQKVTYQYPKIKEVITSNFGENKQDGIDENDEEEKPDDSNKINSTDNIFVFGENHDNDEEETLPKQDDTDKQHINLELFEEK